MVSICALESAAKDERDRELGEGEVELGSSLPADADAAVVMKPGVGAFDRPAFGCLGVAGAAFAGPSFLDDARFDAALAERDAEVFGVVAAVGEELVGSIVVVFAQRRDRVDDRERVAAVVVVGRAQKDRERRAVSVAG